MMKRKDRQGADDGKSKLDLYSQRSCRAGIDWRGDNRRGIRWLLDDTGKPVLAWCYRRGVGWCRVDADDGMARRMEAPERITSGPCSTF